MDSLANFLNLPGLTREPDSLPELASKLEGRLPELASKLEGRLPELASKYMELASKLEGLSGQMDLLASKFPKGAENLLASFLNLLASPIEEPEDQFNLLASSLDLLASSLVWISRSQFQAGKGGRVRSQKLSPERRREIASRAGRAKRKKKYDPGIGF